MIFDSRTFHFNSTIVQLIDPFKAADEPGDANFNSTIVQLIEFELDVQSDYETYFNSTIVQLIAI